MNLPVIKKVPWDRLAAIVSVLAFVGSIASGLIWYFIVNPYDKQIEKLKQDIVEKDSRIDEYRRNTKTLKHDFDTVIIKTERAILLYPRSTDKILGVRTVKFRITRRNADASHYILELRVFHAAKEKTHTVRVDFSSGEALVPVDTLGGFDNGYIDFYWRVRPEYSEELWSDYQRATIYKNMLARIRGTKQITVSGFSNLNLDAPVSTLEHVGDKVDMALWKEVLKAVANEVGSGNIQTKTIRHNSIQDVLSSVSDRNSAIGVGTITPTKDRQRAYQVSFSKSYLSVGELLLAKKDIARSTFPNGLKGSVVGAEKGTTNSISAKYLATKYDFKVKEAGSFHELLDLVDSGEIDFAIVDDFLALRELKKDSGLCVYEAKLNRYLNDLYEETLSSGDYCYAFAVADKSILDIVNNVITKKSSQELINAHIHDFRSSFGTPEVYQCKTK